MKEFTFDIIHYQVGCNCIKCKNHCFPYPDQFVYINDGDRLITYELCLSCLKNIISQECCKCGYSIKDPYEMVYTDFNNNQIFCRDCFE